MSLQVEESVLGGCLHLWVEFCLGTFKSEGDCVSEGVLSI